MQDHHTDFQVTTAGPIINTSLPWMGASPEGIITYVYHVEKDNVMTLKANHKYIKTRLLPELLGKYYTVPGSGLPNLRETATFRMLLW
ncbi:hypothetical protein CHARACLAT_027475 [Characodon lateralis]|uniref:Uncharacterized protein n=1 Tax=Characodon lateralis TaxID=208331 RepID=A0ABU7F6X5_9TELE|nr:hypothetical protein [Characodon lateralis]